MGSVIAFANNQVMIAPSGGSNTIFTDPVPLNDNDRVTCNLSVDYIFNPGANGIAYKAEVSNDGSNWLPPSGGPADNTTSDTVSSGPRQVVGAVHGAFLRFKFTLDSTVGGVSAAGFDLHVLLDHA